MKRYRSGVGRGITRKQKAIGPRSSSFCESTMNCNSVHCRRGRSKLDPNGELDRGCSDDVPVCKGASGRGGGDYRRAPSVSDCRAGPCACVDL